MKKDLIHKIAKVATEDMLKKGFLHRPNVSQQDQFQGQGQGYHCCIYCYWSFTLLSMYISQAALSCTSSMTTVIFALLPCCKQVDFQWGYFLTLKVLFLFIFCLERERETAFRFSCTYSELTIKIFESSEVKFLGVRDNKLSLKILYIFKNIKKYISILHNVKYILDNNCTQIVIIPQL